MDQATIEGISRNLATGVSRRSLAAVAALGQQPSAGCFGVAPPPGSVAGQARMHPPPEVRRGVAAFRYFYGWQPV